MTPARAIIAIGCAYEIVAVTTDRVPTITAMVQRSSRMGWAGRFALWLWLGFCVDHFIDRNDHAETATHGA